MVKNCGGFVFVDCQPGHGATFRMCFSATAPAGRRASAPAKSNPDASATPTVLVVEDEPSILKLIATPLASEDYRLLKATSGRDAVYLSRFRTHHTGRRPSRDVDAAEAVHAGQSSREGPRSARADGMLTCPTGPKLFSWRRSVSHPCHVPRYRRRRRHACAGPCRPCAGPCRPCPRPCRPCPGPLSRRRSSPSPCCSSVRSRQLPDR